MDEKMESSGRPDYLSMHESASVSGNVGKAPCFSLRLLLETFTQQSQAKKASIP